MYTINPGELRHPIQVVQYKDGEVDEDNIPIKNNSNGIIILSTKAKILNLSGKEIILSSGTSSSNSKRFYIRYKNIDISSENKIKYNDKYYDIKSVNDVEEKHKYLEIVAELVE